MTAEFTIAVHSLVFLNHKAVQCSSETLAENVCTNAARIRKVMAKLRKADLVKTKEGNEGGYCFVKNSKHVNLEMVAEALGISFVEASWKSGDPSMECLIASGMAAVMGHLYEDLNQRCRERLREITIADLDEMVFDGSAKRI